MQVKLKPKKPTHTETISKEDVRFHYYEFKVKRVKLFVCLSLDYQEKLDSENLEEEAAAAVIERESSERVYCNL